MEYKTVSEPCEASFTEKKSEFIGYLSPVSSEEEAVAFIEKIRAMHRKATHNCYAYILRENGIARHSDDGEPSGTAGVPIYEVLRREGLSDVCCVVTRYFGGVLLGAGGLVRAYTRGAKDAVGAARIRLMASAAELCVTVDYGMYGRLAQIFAEADARVAAEDFSESVRITVYVREDAAEQLKGDLIEACNGCVDVKIAQKLNYDFAQK